MQKDKRSAKENSSILASKPSASAASAGPSDSRSKGSSVSRWVDVILPPSLSLSLFFLLNFDHSPTRSTLCNQRFGGCCPATQPEGGLFGIPRGLGEARVGSGLAVRHSMPTEYDRIRETLQGPYCGGKNAGACVCGCMYVLEYHTFEESILVCVCVCVSLSRDHLCALCLSQ